MKLKGHCFDNTKDIQIESQAVLDNLTITDFHRVLQQWSAETGVSLWKDTILRLMVASRSYDEFLLIYKTSSENLQSYFLLRLYLKRYSWKKDITFSFFSYQTINLDHKTWKRKKIIVH